MTRSPFCEKPDVDAPKLRCGYPIPCPHHTVIIEEPDLGAAIPTLAWIEQMPCVSIGTYHATENGLTRIHIRALAFLRSKEIWRGVRDFPLTAPMRDLRDAWDELTREAHLELEKHPLVADEPAPQARIRMPFDGVGLPDVSVDNGETWKPLLGDKK